MSESNQHKMLKIEAKERFQNKGYELISMDKKIVNGYKPDIILENEEEVLFIEIVATSDHKFKKCMYNDKPVRYIKYYTLDSWILGKITDRPIYKRKEPKEIIKKIMKSLNKEFKTVSTISKEIGCSEKTISDYLKLIIWIQSCPKLIKVKAGKRIYMWKFNGRLPT